MKTTKGPHYVLTTTAFSDNPNAKLHNKMNENFCKVVSNTNSFLLLTDGGDNVGESLDIIML